MESILEYSLAVTNTTLQNTLQQTVSPTTEFSDYDNQDREGDECRWFRFLFIGIICSVVCVLGMVGNTLSFLVYQRDGSSPVASFLLQSLAVADNLFLLLWTVHYSIREIISFFQYDTWYINVLRMYTFPILYMAQMQTIWLTVIIAMNRFMAVCLPYRAPHICNIYNIYKEVVFITLFSILYNLPRFFELKIGKRNQISRTTLGNDEMYKLIYTDILYYFFTFFLPLFTLSVVNTRVICAFRATQRRRARMMTRRTENDNNITLVMIMVVAVFMLCQAPARIVQMVWSYNYRNCNQVQFYLIHVSNSLEVLNSSVNFLIYIIFRRRFIDILIKNFCAGPLARRHNHSTRSLTTEGLALTEYGKTSLRHCIGGSINCQRKGCSNAGQSGNGSSENEFARYASLHAKEERDVDALPPLCNGSNTHSNHSNGAVDACIEMQEIAQVNKIHDPSQATNSNSEMQEDNIPLTS